MNDLCDLNYVKALLSARGFRFSKSMGQNFLIDRSVPERIAEMSEIDKNCCVLEIGPGIGTLTSHLAPIAGRVVSVELDRSLLPILDVTMGEYSNVEIVPGDVMKLDIRKLAEEKFGGLRPVICANLPYNITTPVLTALMDSGIFTSATVMVQREVAKRICALPDTSDYGAFSVYCAYHASSRILFDVPPESFIPAPKVWSSVVKMDILEKPPVDIPDSRLFFRTVKAAFAQRRKTLVNSLASGFGEIPKQRIAEIVGSCGFPAGIRGEALGIGEFAALANAIKNEFSL